MQITTCPQCGNKNNGQNITTEEIVHRYPSRYACHKCGYHGVPKVLEQYDGVFLGIEPPVPGLIGPWRIKTRLQNGEKKSFSALWDDVRNCIQSLDLQKGDAIRVFLDEETWCVEKIADD